MTKDDFIKYVNRNPNMRTEYGGKLTNEIIENWDLIMAIKPAVLVCLVSLRAHNIDKGDELIDYSKMLYEVADAVGAAGLGKMMGMTTVADELSGKVPTADSPTPTVTPTPSQVPNEFDLLTMKVANKKPC